MNQIRVPSLDVRCASNLTSTVHIDTWIEEYGAAAIPNSVLYPQLNPQAMVSVSTLPTVLGYMTGPINVYKGRPLESAKRKFNDFRELTQFVLDATDGIFIYQVLYSPAYPYFNEADENGCLHPVDSVKYIPESWVLKYAIINEIGIND